MLLLHFHCESTRVNSRRAEVCSFRRPLRLLETPVGLGVFTARRQLPDLASIGEHGIDLDPAAAIRLKHDMPPVGRPRWEVVAPAVMRQLRPLFAGDIHHVDVARARLSWTIVPN